MPLCSRHRLPADEYRRARFQSRLAGRVRAPRPMWQRLWLYAVVAIWPVIIGIRWRQRPTRCPPRSAGSAASVAWAPMFKTLSLAVLVLFFAFLYHAAECRGTLAGCFIAEPARRSASCCCRRALSST